ncbi:MAG: hypothetical protein IJT68_02755 [Lentisphaeria bacterium]|nr:hypothetical protein [Lentisphaeria bacterium]
MTSAFRSFLIAAVFLAAAAVFPPQLRAQGFGAFSGFSMGGISDDDDSDTPTEITANSADIDLEHKVITLIGGVVVDDTSTQITCDRMEIYLEEDAADTLVGKADRPEDSSGEKAGEPDKEDAADGKDGPENADAEEDEENKKNIKTIICLGNVVCTKRADKSKPDEKDQVALAEKAEYDVNKEIIVLTGAHSSPESVVPEDVYAAMLKQVRANTVAKNPLMMQGDTWMTGEQFTVLLKENNRLKVRNMKFSYTGDSLFDVGSGEKDGETEKKTAATLVSSDDADIDLERNLITLAGNVDVEEEASRISCKKMAITLKEKAGKAAEQAPGDRKDIPDGDKDVSEVVCTGEVVFRKHAAPDDPDGDDQIAMSERAVYDAARETILMTGDPVLLQGSNRLYGKSIEIFSKEDNRMKVNTVKAQLAGRLLSSDEEDIPGIPSTTITAATADIRPNEKITLSKNVLVDDGSGSISCNEMEVFLRKDASNPLFSAGKQPQADSAGAAGGDEAKNNVSKIVCLGDVVYRKLADGQEQTVLSQKADYDAVNEVVVMSGAHSDPKSVVSHDTFNELIRAFGTASGGKSGIDPYTILMQGENWIGGEKVSIYPKEGNHIVVTDSMRASLRRISRQKNEEK